MKRTTYRVTENSSRIVADTTPNPAWDKNGPYFLMLEEEAIATGEGLSLEELGERAEEYDRMNNATLPADVRSIELALDWLMQQGLVERLEESER